MMALLKWQAKILNKIYKTNAFEQIVLDHNNLQLINYQAIYKIVEKQQMSASSSFFKAHQHLNINQLLSSVNMICHPTMQSILIRDQIVKLNSLIQKIQNDFNSKQVPENTLNNLDQKIQVEQNSQTQINPASINPGLINYFERNPSEIDSKFHYSIEHVIIYSSLSKCKIWPKMLKTSTFLVPQLIKFYNKFTKDFQYDLSYKFDPLILTHKYEKVMNRIQQKKKSFPELFTAIEKNDRKMIQQLIESCSKIQKQMDFINECKKDSYHLSHHAVMYADLDIIKLLFYDYNINFEKEDQQKQTAIFFAVKRNSFEIVKFLVEQVKVNINHKQYQNRTPIYLGAFQGNLKIVDYLYSKGANPEMESKLSRTPLSKACYLGNISIAEYLIKIGVNLTTIDSKGRTALHNAVWGIEGGRQGKKRGTTKLEDSPQCAQLLLVAGHPVQVEDFDGFTPLMSAAASLAVKSLRVLIKYGANLKHKTKKNETVVFVAAKYGHLQCLKILIEEFNCEYQQPNEHGISPLDASFTTDSTDVCKYLLGLYFDKNRQFSFEKLIKCLCYYKKQNNLRYLLEWSQSDENKQNYIFKGLKYQIENKENFISNLFQNQVDLLPCFLNVLKDHMKRLDPKIIQFVINRSVEAYKKGALINFVSFLCQNKSTLKEKNIAIENLQIQSHTKQEDIIKLLSIDTNITSSHKSIHRCILYLVKRRMTKVLLWILTLHQKSEECQSTIALSDKLSPHFQTERQGIYRFSENEIKQIFVYQTESQNSIQNYCYMNGIHDAIKILQSSQKQTQIKVYIPKYEYSYTIDQNPHPTGVLLPVKQQFFDFNYVLKNHLLQEQADFYSQAMSQYNKRLKQMQQNIKMVQCQEDLKKMSHHFKKCRLIGVDIQHFSNANEQFVCLVQLSGLGQTFLIDTLKIEKKDIKQFLQQILIDQNKIKIFHSYDQDLKWIGQDFQIETFKSILDTSKLFGMLNPKNKSPSLKYLAESILSEAISKDFQRSDWRIRPLFKEMKIYAGTDALLLPFIYLKQLMQANVEVQNQKDKHFYEMVKKQFGGKRYIKCKGRKNILKISSKF